MVYIFSFKIPKGVYNLNPLYQEKILSYGIIRQIDVLFPAGCCGLANFFIYRFNTKIFPINEEGFCSSNNETLSFPTHIKILDRPYSVILAGINYDSKYSHTLQIRFNLEIPESDKVIFSQPKIENELLEFLNS